MSNAILSTSKMPCCTLWKWSESDRLGGVTQTDLAV